MKNMKHIYEHLYNKYSAEVKSLEKICGQKEVRFRHIANNLLSGMRGFQLYDHKDWDSTLKPNFISSAKSLIIYLSLIEQFPDFREAELSSKDGAFPEYNPVGEDLKKYTYYAKDKLRK
ncbi:MAG: hypothetical protein KKF46_03200 [Nanoarchaeota archaeon]|nr:hypothetical protein [Nanoarchaeota archaeon]MBU1321340.1 hypothetical protein [Nanoarchaeota archaeon]MBU1597263.1 hypothetical protein [Nanoarchaeota archaeon]MBU2441477.1 hypothetical protein [Nanoarchaeota archaeon]